MPEPFDLTTTPVHLGRGGTATPLEGFSWDPAYFGPYVERTAADGDDARLVLLARAERSWDEWEAHPHGAQLVVCVSGRATLVQDREGDVHVHHLTPGDAAVNPPGTWHTLDVDEPAELLFVTSGRGTGHRPR